MSTPKLTTLVTCSVFAVVELACIWKPVGVVLVCAGVFGFVWVMVFFVIDGYRLMQRW